MAAAPERASLEVAVVGAGIAGIAAATVLARHGASVTLLERYFDWGGKIKAWRASAGGAADVPAEHGVHGWWSNYSRFRELLKEAEAGAVELVQVRSVLIVDLSAGREARRFLLTPELLAPFWVGLQPFGLLRLLAPRMLGGALKLAVAVSRFFGGLTGLMLIAGYVVSRSRLLLQVAAKLSGRVRLWCDFAAVPPARSLDEMSLTDFCDKVRAPTKVAKVLDLLQSWMAYGSSSVTSAYFIARCADFYALRDPEAFWFEICAGSSGEVVDLLRGQAVAANVRFEPGSLVTEVSRTTYGETASPRFEIKVHDTPLAKTFDRVVFAVDVPGAKRLVEGEGSEIADDIRRAITSQGENRVLVLRLWFSTTWQAVFGSSEYRAMAVIDSDAAGCPFDFAFFLSGIRRGGAEFEGTTVEVHIARAERFEEWSRRRIVEATCEWLCSLCATDQLASSGVVHSALNEINGFSRAQPGHLRASPEIGDGSGICFAGDWVLLDEPLAYMEKAIVTGEMAAHRILGSHRPADRLPPISLLQRNATAVSRRA